jgi:SulP family sulfate permease
VGLVAITLSIPFAIASGAGANAPQVGLATVVVAGGVAALFGGSRLLVTGPTGGFIVVLASIAQRQGVDGLLAATMLAGLILLLAGVLRLGKTVKFIPYPVTVGFTAGIALSIFLGQLPDILGATLAHPASSALARAGGAAQAVLEGAWHPWSLAVVVLTVALAQAGGRLLPRVPSLVTGLVLASAIVLAAHVPVPTLADKYALPHGLPAPRLPAWDPARLPDLLPDALTIAFLAALQSLLAAVVADGMARTRHDPDQELIGQGLANLAAPLFGGIAAAGAVARTATGIQNGARTPVAALVHAGVVLAVLLALGPAVGLVPIPVLVGILVVVCWNMAQRQHLRRLHRMPRADAGILLCTLLLTVAVGLNVAIAVGMVLAMGTLMQQLGAATRVVPAAHAADAEAPLTFSPADVPPDVAVYSIDGPFFFGAADQFRDAIARIGRKPRAVILRLRDVPYIDSTALNVLLAAVEDLHRRGTRVLLSGIRSQPLQLLEEAGAVHVLGQENLFRTTAEALRALDAPAP